MTSTSPSAPSDSPPAPARRRRKAARPAELLEAATALFIEKGYAATRVEEVAARAQVSKGTLFLYYPSKEALLKAAVQEHISGRYREWEDELAAFTGSTADLVRYAFQVWWERIGSTPAAGICKLLAAESAHFPDLAQLHLREVIEPGNQLVRRILQRGMDRGEFRPIPLDAAMHLMLTPMFAYVHWQYSIGLSVPQYRPAVVDPQTYFQVHVDNLLRGLMDGCTPRA